MKTITSILLAMFCVAMNSAMGQGIILNSGDIYSYQFGTLPFLQVTTWSPAAVPSANLYWTAISLSEGTQLEVRMFENSLDDSPLITHTWISETGLSGNIDLHPPNFPSVWQDLQGTFSMQVLSGSARITDFRIIIDVPTDAIHTLKYYKEFTLVPEPTPSALFAAAAILGVVWRITCCTKTPPNPQGGGNGRQPFSPDPKSASAALASRRSP